jgi:hypothetical protein
MGIGFLQELEKNKTLVVPQRQENKKMPVQ